MIHVLGTELRRSHARILAILLILGSLATLAVDSDAGRQWSRFVYDMTGNVFIQLPLALAGGAMLGRRERRTGAAELLGSTGRPRWQKITPTTAALALTVVVVQLLILAFGAARIGVAGGFVSLHGAVPVLADLTILVGAAWLGLAAGRAWASPVLPPVLAALGLVVQLAGDFSEDPASYSPSRLSSWDLTAQPPASFWEIATSQAVLGRLVLGLGLALGALLLLAGTNWLSRTLGIATVIAGLVLTMYVTPLPGTGKSYQVDAAAQELVCADGTPQVCVTAVNAYQLDDVTTAARRALTLLAKLPGAQDRAVEWRPGAQLDLNQGNAQFWGKTPTSEPGTVVFPLGGEYGPRSAADVTANILNGAGTMMNGCEPGDETALGAAGAWLMGTDTLPLSGGNLSSPGGDPGQIAAIVTDLRKLPEKEQIRRVTALRDAAAACASDHLLELLTEGRSV
ncbi:hypothetical protein [Actinoplanes sp. NPDC051494]|uniref:hypothetical protein n=1 Tax=Actinoplanes sp. NPDC051494 TaxID=3363907 RepID=UPI0037AE485E